MMKRLAINMITMEAGQPGAYTTAGALMNSPEELVARVRQGDHDAFRLIFERYARPLISFIYDMVGERALAEDLAQETFVRAYKNLPTLKDEARLSTWLFGIAKNVARESLRTRRRDRNRIGLDEQPVMELSDKERSPAGQLLDKELSGVIQNALLMLDEDSDWSSL